MGVSLGGPFDFGSGGGPGGWWILDEPELHLGIDQDYEVIVPDLAGWRRDRMPTLPETAWFEMAPDWVCEVLSPSTAAIDRAEKMPFYARARVSHTWLVDPILETLEVFRLDGDTWRLLATHRGSVSVRAEPFDAVEIDIGRLWVPREKKKSDP
jgi:Uma2 family endonuclease